MENDVFVSIGKAALLLGVSISTLRRWTDGMGVRGLVWFRTEGNHRRFSLKSIQCCLGKDVSVKRKERMHVATREYPAMTKKAISPRKSMC